MVVERRLHSHYYRWCDVTILLQIIMGNILNTLTREDEFPSLVRTNQRLPPNCHNFQCGTQCGSQSLKNPYGSLMDP